MNAGAAEKYNDLAEGFAEQTWANLAFDMRRRLILATTWGKALYVGDSVVEFGCGDGYLAQLFVHEGFHYRGLDISPKMVAEAERRLAAAELTASFLAVDVDQVSNSAYRCGGFVHEDFFYFHSRSPKVTAASSAVHSKKNPC